MHGLEYDAVASSNASSSSLSVSTSICIEHRLFLVWHSYDTHVRDGQLMRANQFVVSRWISIHDWHIQCIGYFRQFIGKQGSFDSVLAKISVSEVRNFDSFVGNKIGPSLTILLGIFVDPIGPYHCTALAGQATRSYRLTIAQTHKMKTSLPLQNREERKILVLLPDKNQWGLGCILWRVSQALPILI